MNIDKLLEKYVGVAQMAEYKDAIKEVMNKQREDIARIEREGIIESDNDERLRERLYELTIHEAISKLNMIEKP